MRISLMKKLSLCFILTALGSIILTSLISNYIIDEKFKDYLVDEHKSKVENIVKIIGDLYEDENRLSSVSKSEITRYAHLQELYIEVKDLNNNIIYSSGSDHLQSGHMMDHMMNSYSKINIGNYTEDKYPLLIKDERMGSIVIGYFGTSYLSSGSVTFINTLNKSFILSAAFALIFSLMISIIISRQISQPISKITETANKMSSGELEVRAVTNTNTKEIHELSSSINYLAETLTSQEMLRKKLTSDMAHELSTPLTTLKTHVEAFIDGVWEPNSERLEDFYEEIERLTKLVDSIRSLARLEQATLNLNKSEVNLSNELEKIVDTFKPMYIKRNYELTKYIETKVEVVLDKDKFKQIMYNLLTNSYNHLRADGTVEVILKKEKNNIIIKVMDNGIGIPEKDLPYIFERFYRSDLSRDKNTGGSGIGLTITKAFVESHGGKISVESKINCGTTFTIEFANMSLK